MVFDAPTVLPDATIQVSTPRVDFDRLPPTRFMASRETMRPAARKRDPVSGQGQAQKQRLEAPGAELKDRDALYRRQRMNRTNEEELHIPD